MDRVSVLMMRTAATMVLLLVLFPVAVTANSTTDLRTALIPASDAPPGFSQPVHHLYTAFTLKITVSYQEKHLGTVTSSCDLPASYRADGWRQGLIQAFKSANPLSAFQLCASSFASARGAHAAFLQQAKLVARKISGMPGVQNLPIVEKLGDERFALGAQQRPLASGALLFRHSNAVIELFYLGPSTYGFNEMVKVAVGVDRRVR